MLDHAGATCSSSATYFPWHCVILPEETFELRQRLLTLSLLKLKLKVEAVSEKKNTYTYMPLFYGAVYYTTNSFCENVLETAASYRW